MTKEKILNISKKLIEDIGFKKLTVDEIAKNIGITKKTLYRYFSSKEILLEELVDVEIKNIQNIFSDENTLYKNLSTMDRFSKKIENAISYKGKSKLINRLLLDNKYYSNTNSLTYLKKIDGIIQENIEKDLSVLNPVGYDIKVLSEILAKLYLSILFDNKTHYKLVSDNISKLLKEGLCCEKR